MKWIDVRTALPKDGEEVLVVLAGGQMVVAWYDNDDSTWNIEEHELELVEFWTPLPPRPGAGQLVSS